MKGVFIRLYLFIYIGQGENSEASNISEEEHEKDWGRRTKKYEQVLT